MAEIVVITGAGAGVGRAAAREFARHGFDVGLIGRDADRLEAAAGEVRAMGMRATVAIADVADAKAIEAAAEAIECALGPIAVWVNNAMATLYAPVAELDADEFRRATEVTYLGTVHGTMAALKRMRRRGRGSIVNIGSALAYRSIPLQSVYCGAKSAIRGFTDSLRSEILHDGDDIYLTMVHLPAVNTPQFDWARNKTGYRAQPMGAVIQPEAAAAAILYAATHRRREWWVGFSTVRAILANRIAPALADRRLATSAYAAQLGKEPAPEGRPDNLFDSVPGPAQAHGRFDARAADAGGTVFSPGNKSAFLAALGAGLLGAALLSRFARRA